VGNRFTEDNFNHDARVDVADFKIWVEQRGRTPTWNTPPTSNSARRRTATAASTAHQLL
jgi:hypothetical protein